MQHPPPIVPRNLFYQELTENFTKELIEEDRLWQLLLLLKEEIGQSVVNGTRLALRFTHQSLAKFICTTRVTVTRILGDFQSRELISIDSDRHIIIRE